MYISQTGFYIKKKKKKVTLTTEFSGIGTPIRDDIRGAISAYKNNIPNGHSKETTNISHNCCVCKAFHNHTSGKDSHKLNSPYLINIYSSYCVKLPFWHEKNEWISEKLWISIINVNVIVQRKQLESKQTNHSTISGSTSFVLYCPVNPGCTSVEIKSGFGDDSFTGHSQGQNQHENSLT